MHEVGEFSLLEANTLLIQALERIKECSNGSVYYYGIEIDMGFRQESVGAKVKVQLFDEPVYVLFQGGKMNVIHPELENSPFMDYITGKHDCKDEISFEVNSHVLAIARVKEVGRKGKYKLSALFITRNGFCDYSFSLKSVKFSSSVDEMTEDFLWEKLRGLYKENNPKLLIAEGYGFEDADNILEAIDSHYSAVIGNKLTVLSKEYMYRRLTALSC